MSFDNIVVIFSFIGLIYYYGFKNGLLFFVLLVLIGIIAALILEGYFFGDIGKYVFLLITIPIAIVVYIKKYR
jgi:hypothetical protein